MLTAAASLLVLAQPLVPAPSPPDLLTAGLLYYSPGGTETDAVDVAFAEEVDAYGVTWQRETLPGKTLICFSTAQVTGAPKSPPIVLGSLAPGEVLTSGPVITDTNYGSEFAVAWASQGAGGVEVFIRTVRPAGSSWYSPAGLSTRMSSNVQGLDIGASESREAVIVGSSGGQIFAETLYFTSGVPYLGSYGVTWIPRPAGAADQDPSIARSDEVMVVWERWADEGVSIFGRSGRFYGEEDETEPVELLTHETGFISDPRIAGSGARGVVVARALVDGLRHSIFGVAVTAPLDSSCGGACPSAMELLVELEPYDFLQGYSVGEVGGDRFALVWGQGYEDFKLRGVGMDPDLTPLEAPFEIEGVDPDSYPGVSDNPSTTAHTALVGWGGLHPTSSDRETRGALIRAGGL